MRRMKLSLSRLLLEQDADRAIDYAQLAFEQLMNSRVVLEGPPEGPSDAGAGGGEARAETETRTPRTPEELRAAVESFVEKANKAKNFLEENSPLGVQLSSELLNADENTLTKLAALADEAIRLDGNDKIPLHQMAAAALIAPPGVGWQTVNELFGVFTGVVELLALRTAAMPGVTIGPGGGILVAVPGLVAGVETALRYYESPFKTDRTQQEKTIGAEDVPADIFKESFRNTYRRKRYSLAQSLNEATIDDANVRAVLRGVLGPEILSIEGSLAEKIFAKMLRDNVVSGESTLGLIIDRVRGAASRLKQQLLTNEDLKKFITANAEEIFDPEEIRKYTNQIKEDMKREAVMQAAKDLQAAGTDVDSVIDNIIEELQAFYEPYGGTVTDTDKELVSGILKEIYATPDLTPAQRLEKIAAAVRPKWADKFDAISKNQAYARIGRDSALMDDATALNQEINDALESSLGSFGFTPEQAYGTAIRVEDFSGNEIDAIFNGVQVVQTSQPDTFAIVIEVTVRGTNQSRYVPVSNFLNAWKGAGEGIVSKAQAADRAFQSQIDTAVSEISSALDQELVVKEPKDWAEFLNRAIDKSESTNLLDTSLQSISAAANLPGTAGRAVKTSWRGLGSWFDGVKNRQIKLYQRGSELTDIQRAYRERAVATLFFTAIFDYFGEDVFNKAYAYYFADAAVYNNFATFLGMVIAKDPAEALANNALTVANAIVTKFSTGSSTGSGPLQAAPEQQIINAASSWQTMHENIKAFAEKLPEKKAAESMQESMLQLRALIRESLILNSLRTSRR